MAHFSSVNEDALLSAISNCKSSIAAANRGGDIVSKANMMAAKGYKTKASIISATTEINSLVKSIKSDLDACYKLATLIKTYKLKKAKVDELEGKLETLKTKIASLERARSNCWDMYNSLKDTPGRESEASAYYNEYVSYGPEIEAKQAKYEQYKKRYDNEKAEMKRIGKSLAGMGFPPESN